MQNSATGLPLVGNGHKDDGSHVGPGGFEKSRISGSRRKQTNIPMPVFLVAK